MYSIFISYIKSMILFNRVNIKYQSSSAFKYLWNLLNLCWLNEITQGTKYTHMMCFIL